MCGGSVEWPKRAAGQNSIGLLNQLRETDKSELLEGLRERKFWGMISETT
jgi:hypothetical protein